MPFCVKNVHILIIKHILVNKNVSKHQKKHSNVYDLTFNHLFLPEQVISHHWRLKLIFKPKLRFPQQPQSKQIPFHPKRPDRRAPKRWCVWAAGFSSFVPDSSGSGGTFCPGWDTEAGQSSTLLPLSYSDLAGALFDKRPRGPGVSLLDKARSSYLSQTLFKSAFISSFLLLPLNNLFQWLIIVVKVCASIQVSRLKCCL